jgi:hypothetical protein
MERRTPNRRPPLIYRDWKRPSQADGSSELKKLIAQPAF